MADHTSELPPLSTSSVRLDKTYYLIGLALQEFEQAYAAYLEWVKKNSDHSDLEILSQCMDALGEDISRNEFLAYNVLRMIGTESGLKEICLTYEQDKRMARYWEIAEIKPADQKTTSAIKAINKTSSDPEVA